MSVRPGIKPSGIPVLDSEVSPKEKAEFVKQMFDEISPRYDFLNSALSAGIHRAWRVFATRCAGLSVGDSALDVCSGTGEWISELKRLVGESGHVVGLDFSFGMLQSGRLRFERNATVRLQADATRLPFQNNTFDAVTVAFGIRNVADPALAFREMTRVLRPNGKVVCLEFSHIKNPVFRTLYNLHARFLMPLVGGLVSGRRDAYTYLPESVKRFYSRQALAAIMEESGLTDVRVVDLMLGLVSVHVGAKVA